MQSERSLPVPRTAALLAAPLLAITLDALFVATAAAADPPASTAQSKSAPKKKSNVMTRDELRVCMAEQDRLQRLSEKVKQDQASLDRQRADVEKMDAEIARKRAALDPADVAAAEALQTDVARRDEVVDAYNARLPALREQGSTYDAGRQVWVERCANRDYDELDEAAIKREQKRAAAKQK
jgi:hypothetical protein